MWIPSFQVARVRISGSFAHRDLKGKERWAGGIHMRVVVLTPETARPPLFSSPLYNTATSRIPAITRYHTHAITAQRATSCTKPSIKTTIAPPILPPSLRPPTLTSRTNDGALL